MDCPLSLKWFCSLPTRQAKYFPLLSHVHDHQCQGSYQKLVYDDEQPDKSEFFLGISCSHKGLLAAIFVFASQTRQKVSMASCCSNDLPTFRAKMSLWWLRRYWLFYFGVQKSMRPPSRKRFTLKTNYRCRRMSKELWKAILLHFPWTSLRHNER